MFICKYLGDVENRTCYTEEGYSYSKKNHISGIISKDSLVLTYLLISSNVPNPSKYPCRLPTNLHKTIICSFKLTECASIEPITTLTISSDLSSVLEKIGLFVIGAPLMSLANIVYHVVATIFSAIKLILAFAPYTEYKITKEAGHVAHHINCIIRNAIRAIPIFGLILTKAFDMVEIVASDVATIACKAACCRPRALDNDTNQLLKRKST